uniref:Putative TNP1-like transposon protein n=1 Tax=Arabidopsis thaliana TaxID=3702 RepID=Q9SK21_ARATH|nr:putative TNP1-like transposon protein [Arabidopsis thaliana]
MKNLAKDPTVRVKVDYNLMGEAIGPGSVKLSSYVGTLMREHVPINIVNWKKVTRDLKTVLWKSIQARFELDEDWQRISVINQMGNLWRAHKSRRVKAINLAANNQERMNLRPTNINPVEWQKFVKLKTSSAFKKLESGDPSSVTRLQVWIKSRTKKDGTPVDTNAAEKIQEAAEIVGSDAPTFSTNPDEDHLAKLLGPDNPGRLRVMGRGMSKTKLACLQVKNTCMAEMEERQVKLKKQVNDLEDEIIRIKNQRPEAEMGENSAARSVNRKSHRKCVFVDWSETDENVGEGRILSSDPDDIVNDCRLGPTDLKVLVETAYQPDAFLWRPAHKIFNMKEAVGHIIAWPADKCKLLDTDIQIEDIAPLGLKGNKCKLLDLKNAEVIVAEGRWETQEPSALVNGLPLGPKAVKVFVDSVKQPDTSLWRPTAEISYLEDCLMAFVAWPLSKVDFENPSSPTGHNSTSEVSRSASKAKSAATASKSADGSKTSATASKAASESKSAAMSSKSASGSESPIDDATGPSSPIRNTLPA